MMTRHVEGGTAVAGRRFSRESAPASSDSPPGVVHEQMMEAAEQYAGPDIRATVVTQPFVDVVRLGVARV